MKANQPGKQPGNQLRIIAGTWRGRKLAFADSNGVRPTPDRVRETLFNWLSPVIHGARCLDLFAGSGALGFEAASRGAADVVLVDHDAAVVRMLKSQVERLAAENIRVVEMDAGNFLRHEPQSFDVIFLDPPFRENRLAACLDLLVQGGWLAANALIYIEAEKTLGEIALPAGWELFRSKMAGQVGYHLARRMT